MKRPLATTILRAELREGLETMPLSRPQLKIAAALAALFVLLLSSSAHAQPVDDHTITAEGIGNAVLGLSPAELIEALGPDYQVGDEVRITIDFDGRVVSRNGTVQFRAAMTDDTETLTLFMVSNPEYTTAEGIGPTSTIAEAEAVYGPAMLAWNPDNGGREFVSFANGPDGRIAFRTPGIGGTNVGIYASGEFSTSAYEDGAAIAAVWVICVSGTDCAADVATAEPTPTPETDGHARANRRHRKWHRFWRFAEDWGHRVGPDLDRFGAVCCWWRPGSYRTPFPLRFMADLQQLTHRCSPGQ